MAWAQTAAPQPGTLQVPATPRAEAQMTPPAAAPRQPVQGAGGGAKAAKPPPPATAPAPGHTPPGHTPPGHTATLPIPPIPPATAPAAPADHPATPEETGHSPAKAEKPDAGAKLPRFVSLRSDEVNLRAGPGTRYPIQWVYKRRDLPVEIEREFEVWRLVRDSEGVRGWVHQATLTGRRTFVVRGADATLRADAKDTAAAVAVLRAGVIGRLRLCEAGSTWCEVRVGTYRGYLKRDQIWGLQPNEAIKQ